MASKSIPARQPHKSEQSQVLSQQWSGPLPPPAALDHFNQIIPNGAERIMAMVEREQAERHKADEAILVATIGDTRRGHWIGLAIAAASIAGSVATAVYGAHPTVSIALVSLPLVAIVKSIVSSKSSSK